MFKVEMRTTCKVCGSPIKQKRFRSYCSKDCRTKFFNGKYNDKRTIWQRNRNDARASKPDPRKVQCLVCKRWYVQVCTHALQRHGMTGREYREHFDLEVKRGVVPSWYRELKGDQAIENKTYKNLKAGEEYRFVKGSKSAGRYHRSHITLARLSKLYGYKKRNN